MKNNLRKILKNAIRYFNFFIWKNENGIRFKIPVIKRIGTQNIKKTEPWMSQLLQILLFWKENGAFIDFGVNLGQTLLKVRSISSNIEYYGFEPNPACLFYLEELIKINKIINTHIFPVAIGEKIDIVSLYLHETDDTAGSSASTLKDFKNSAITFQKNIPIFPFTYFYDNFIHNKSIGIIKIDVEGAELEAVNGALKVISSENPFIICELLPPINSLTREETLEKKKEIQRILENENYNCYKIVKGKDDTLKKLTFIRDVALETLNSKGWDYLFVPKSATEFLSKNFNIN